MRRASLAILAVMAISGPAFAQDAAPPARMSDTPCPPPAPATPRERLQAVLTPGSPPPPMQTGGPITDPGYLAYLKRRDAERLRDFAAMCRYKPDNAAQMTRGRPEVVMMGDSITENWGSGDPALVSGSIVDRGISGQTSPQMLLRFYQDVVALKPRIVHIMAGTNDVAGNTGPSSPEDFRNTVRAMVDLARGNDIAVILASIPPTQRFSWRPDLQPADTIRSLNDWLRTFAAERKIVFADYYRAMAAPAGGMRPDLSNDGVHPTTAGYAVMRPVFEAAVRQALRAKRRG
ncbi:GDSL-type esterase/lipase family protein [Sphingomonas sp. CROZ-RG-20F-R02-07]|uniref:GDSL-type esterase/lipase family protein n=1 Tax=Sphingomonas sp. CROZ-RG-20F-R02-07 TaxID=2914832 RepID=UPI001F566025|nr:GDSL-type esterase/lipase family protein [Sphingomonas sp. CROZ-RG-20F-R02-07]